MLFRKVLSFKTKRGEIRLLNDIFPFNYENTLEGFRNVGRHVLDFSKDLFFGKRFFANYNEED